MKLLRGLIGAIVLLGLFGAGALAESFDIFEYTTPRTGRKATYKAG